jgi:hypothetical protein
MKEHLEVSTVDRENYNTSSSHNCVIHLQKKLYDIEQIRLINAQIPLTFYAFNSSNNIIHTSLGNATIVAGNYNTNELVSHMITILNAATTPATWTITYSEQTNKLTFVCTSAYIFQFSNTSSACYNLGFPSVNTISGTTNTSTRSINISGDLNCYLRFREFYNPDTITSSGSYFSFKIPLTHKYNEIEFYVNQSSDENTQKIQVLKNLFILHVELLRYNGSYLDLNNSDFNFMLEIEYKDK